MIPYRIYPFLIPTVALVFLGVPGYYYYNNNFNHLNNIQVLPAFPLHIQVNYTEYKNWAGDIKTEAWTAYPRNAREIVELTNWARHENVKIRPSGSRHTWAPLTILPSEHSTDSVLIVDTTRHLNKMGIISTHPGNSFFWAETGMDFVELLGKLEEKNLGIGSFPNVDGPSLGGILAVGGRGVGSYGTNNEVNPPDHTFGSVSNLIVSLTAVVYNPIFDSYQLQEFHRSLPETKAFLVHHGRAFITNVTMRAGPLLNYTLNSRVDIKPEMLFSPVSHSQANGEETFAGQLQKFQRVAVAYLETIGTLWLKTWEVSGQKPANAYELEDIGEIVPDIKLSWGRSKNALIVVSKDLLPLSLAGWAVITNHDNIQKVVSEFYQIFNRTLDAHREKKASLKVGLEIRTAELDHRIDVGIPGAESPGLGTLQPIPDRLDLNVAIYLNVLSHDILTGPGGKDALKFLTEVERKVFHHFDTEWSVVRVEWSKCWGLTEEANVFDRKLIRDLKSIGRFTNAWDYSVATLDKYDPFRIFTNALLDDLFHRDDHIDTIVMESILHK